MMPVPENVSNPFADQTHDCQLANAHANGGFSAAGGQEPHVTLECGEHGWRLVFPEWCSVAVKHCPWCGEELPFEPFQLGEDDDENNPSMDDLLDQLDAAMGGEQ